LEIVKDDDAAHRQHLVDIEKIDKNIVECVLAVQESKVDLLVPGKQLRETLERGFLIELDAIVISGSLEIGEADGFKSGVRTRIAPRLHNSDVTVFFLEILPSLPPGRRFLDRRPELGASVLAARG
jgi:hypothetical protein